jgi:hypothetical protein
MAKPATTLCKLARESHISSPEMVEDISVLRTADGAGINAEFIHPNHTPISQTASIKKTPRYFCSDFILCGP